MKIRNKLILSCAALAAVATTAVSTTFAWYTSNTTVTATGVTAGTDAANSSTLQIGKLGNDWGSTVDIDIDAGKFDPVSYGANGNGKDAAGTADDTNFYLWGSDAVSTSVAAANTNYVQFHLYFRNLPAADADHVLLKSVTLKNATEGALPTTQTLVGDGLLATGKTRTDLPAYSVNLLRALSLKLDYVQKTFTDTDTFNAAAATDADVASTSGSAIYSLDAFHTSDTVAAANKKADSIDDTTKTKGTSANAHEYYNAVKSANIATSNPLSESADLGTKYANATYTVGSKADAIDLGIAKGTQKIVDGTPTALAASYVYTTWTIFLNGWDTMCFDGVKGQKITLSLTFATTW